MFIKHFVFGPIETNCYLVACDETLNALVIDPDIRAEKENKKFFGAINNHHLKLKYIVNTHHHIDHTGGNAMLKQTTGAKILIHELDAPVLDEQWKWIVEMDKIRKPPPCPLCGNDSLYNDIMAEQKKADLRCRNCSFIFEVLPSPGADRLLRDGDVINIGEIKLQVILTPGHCAGGICLYIEKEHVLFSGDTLFNLSIGRTDMIDSSSEDIIKSCRKLIKLPEDTIVYPGHGKSTTIGEERRHNYYLQN
jgi:glyoxylase-like metal-dependent hydrolase (beta-lactamase superfamily II)